MCLLLRNVSREDGYGDKDGLPVVIGGQWGRTAKRLERTVKSPKIDT